MFDPIPIHVMEQMGWENMIFLLGGSSVATQKIYHKLIKFLDLQQKYHHLVTN